MGLWATSNRLEGNLSQRSREERTTRATEARRRATQRRTLRLAMRLRKGNIIKYNKLNQSRLENVLGLLGEANEEENFDILLELTVHLAPVLSDRGPKKHGGGLTKL